MHRPIVLFVMLAALVASECMVALVLAFQPLYTDRDTVFEPSLLGTWVQKGGATWTFRRASAGHYDLETTHDDSPAKFEARLVRLSDYLFLDVYPGEPGSKNLYYLSHLLKGHSFARIWIKGDVVLLALLNEEWLKAALNQGDVAISNLRIHDHILLTADTGRLQELVVTYADDPRAFPISVGLIRRR